MWIYDTGIACHREGCITQTTIYYEYMCLCWVSRLFGMIWLFSNYNLSSITRFRSWFITFYLRCKCTNSYVPVLLAMQWGVALRSAFYRSSEHLYIVFSYNILKMKVPHWGMGMEYNITCMLFRKYDQNLKGANKEKSGRRGRAGPLWSLLVLPLWACFGQ